MSHRKPVDTTDLLRDVLRRLEALENPSVVRVRNWVLSENANGDLVATSRLGRTVVLSDEPEQVTIVQQTTAEEEEPET